MEIVNDDGKWVQVPDNIQEIFNILYDLQNKLKEMENRINLIQKGMEKGASIMSSINKNEKFSFSSEEKIDFVEKVYNKMFEELKSNLFPHEIIDALYIINLKCIYDLCDDIICTSCLSHHKQSLLESLTKIFSDRCMELEREIGLGK